MSRKTLVLDTSVLLYDKKAIHSFPDNDVILPLPVLEELDKFKEKPGLLGESARYVNRYLDELRIKGRLDKKVEIEENNQTISVITDIDLFNNVPIGLDPGSNDNLIIAAALSISKKYSRKKVKLITKDINLRVKCDALGIVAEDYYKDHIEILKLEPYSGMTSLDLSSAQIDEFYSEGACDIEDECFENQCIVGKSYDNKSLLGMYKDGKLHKLPNIDLGNTTNLEAKNKEQLFAMNMLTDPGIQLVSISGIAGSGKTYITLMCGFAGLLQEKYKRIVITRSIQPVGRDLGYLPGDINEKMQPWLAPIIDNFRHGFKDLTYFDIMREKGEIEIAPLSYIRGRTFNDAYIIVDEAQNASIHELKTIITRVGKGSKIVLLGDTQQVDTPYLNEISNGLSIVIQKFKDSDISGHIKLVHGQRSELATVASNIL